MTGYATFGVAALIIAISASTVLVPYSPYPDGLEGQEPRLFDHDFALSPSVFTSPSLDNLRLGDVR